MQNNELVKSMEFVIKQLHTEWERSGEIKTEVILDMAQLNSVMISMAQKIAEKRKQSDEDLTFSESIIYSHENYILLRTIRKFMYAKYRLEKSDAVFTRILLDKEEMRVYQDMVSE